jgi:hypothetical protein
MRCEYDVKVIIGAADIIFELWHNGKKLSEDNPMPVDWFDVTAPPLERVTRRYDDTPELPAMSKSRKLGSTANLYNPAGVSPISQTRVSPASHNTASPVAPPSAYELQHPNGNVYEIGQNNLGHAAARAQELPLNQTPGPRYNMPAVGSPLGGYWQPPIQYQRGPAQYQQVASQYQQVPVGYPPMQYQQVPVSYQQVPANQPPAQVHELPTGTAVVKEPLTMTTEVSSPLQPDHAVQA